MIGPKEQYIKEIKEKFGYLATWLPGSPLSLGDIGVLNDNSFSRLGSVKDKSFGINFNEILDESEDDLEYSSKGQVTITNKISGNISNGASSLLNTDVGIIVDFGRENSVYFKSIKSRVNLISDSISLGEDILKLYHAGKWNKNWVVITELVKVESSTILISNSQNARIELKANANINSKVIDIADSKFEFGVNFSKGLETKIISANGLTPLFKARGIKSRIFLPPTFIDKGIRPFDLVTPETARKKFKNDLYFDYIF